MRASVPALVDFFVSAGDAVPLLGWESAGGAVSTSISVDILTAMNEKEPVQVQRESDGEYLFEMFNAEVEVKIKGCGCD